VLENVRAILAAAGSSMAKVVKTNVYLTDIADFAAMNEVYATFFPAEPPPVPPSRRLRSPWASVSR